MTHRKKQIHIIIVSILVAFFVTMLYPFGIRLMQIVRAQNDSSRIQSGKEVIYSYIDQGDLRIADEILENKYELNRFKPVQIDSITWTEDPFSDLYWRFNYYNLESVRHLVFAWETTKNPVYKDKLIEITESFLDKGMDGPYSWDYHGTAFRTMTLVNVWVKLKKENELSNDLNLKILQAMRVHGDFLADSAHFEGNYNHGLDQSAALYLLAINFPDLPEADNWLQVSSGRLGDLVTNIVDSDGILVENSPFYHFYVLEKFWEIKKYLEVNDLSLSADFDEKIDKMISYATYVLQPDLNVPTLGASLGKQLKLSDLYVEMAKSHPDLLYVLTKGAEGKRPSALNMHYPISGQTIMRSGWEKGKDYMNQVQLIFDSGSYRTNHSDLDALSFNLYGGGLALMPDAGLYTYDAGPYRNYFHGTRSHNTVVVDGKDQNSEEKRAGSVEKVYPGFFGEGDGYAYQSGEHELYPGVSHSRAVALIEDSTVLVFDKLESSSLHTYEQMFHLFPGAEVSTDGMTLTAIGLDPKQSLTIRQFVTSGVELSTAIDEKDPPDGLCSVEYGVAVPCYSVSYTQKGQNASYVTAISIGKDIATVDFDQNSNLVEVKTKNGSYTIKINQTDGTERSIEVNKNFNMSKLYSSLQFADSLNILDEWYLVKENSEKINLKNIGTVNIVKIDKDENSLEIVTPTSGSYFEVARDINLDLSDKTLYFKAKVDKAVNLQDFEVFLSNDNWTNYAKYSLRHSVFGVTDIHRDNEWFQYGLGKSDSMDPKFGGWEKSSPTFDWSKIDSIKFNVMSEMGESVTGESVTIDIGEFHIIPDQRESRAIVFFDDGWASVMDAAEIMRKYGLKGNVPVITSVIDSIDRSRYMTLDDLKLLQNDYGWNIVNHTAHHKNATVEYVEKNNLKAYENDVTDALQYMVHNDINSAPNWFVYPHGKTDKSTKAIIEKYYKFARATIDGPEVFPFAEPLEVRVFSVYSDNTTNQDTYDAINDAIKYNQTIMLMFHKFSEGSLAVSTEWNLKDFESIVKYLKKSGIRVVTLSELDKKNGIPETKFKINDFMPKQIKLDVSASRSESLLQRLNPLK